MNMKIVPDSMREKAVRRHGGNGSGRPLSEVAQALLDGRTVLMDEDYNPDNVRATMRKRGFRLCTGMDPRGNGRLMWLEALEPVETKRGRRAS